MKPDIQPSPPREWKLLSPAGLRKLRSGTISSLGTSALWAESFSPSSQAPTQVPLILLLPLPSQYMCTPVCTSTSVASCPLVL